MSAPGASGWSHWWRSRLCREWRLKAQLSAAVAPAFLLGYFWIQRHPFFAAHHPPETALDAAIGFAPGWTWVYESLYIPLNLVAWLSRERGELFRLVLAIGIASVVGFGIFVLYPTVGPRPPMDQSGGLYGMVVLFDRPGNALPSLHAALLACTLTHAARIGLKYLWLGALIVWSGLILYATLATKQHYAVDLAAGFALGLIATWLAWLGAGQTAPSGDALSASSKRLSNSGRVSQEGLR